MSVFDRMLNTQALMFIYVVTGIIMAKTKILKHEGRSSFINLLLDITLPCMILNSFNVDIGIDELISAGKIMVISSVLTLIAWILSKVFWRKEPQNRRAVLEFSTLFSNAGNAGMPIVASVFGARGVFYASFYLLPVRVLIWTLGLSLFVDEGNFRDKIITLMKTPSLIVVFIGIGLMFLPFKLPGVVSVAVKNIGDMTGPLSMMIIGAALGESDLRAAFEVDAFKLTAVRLAVLPVLYSFQDIKITSWELGSLSPRGLSAFDAVLNLEVDNPAPQVSLSEMTAVIKLDQVPCLHLTADDITLVPHRRAWYTASFHGSLDENFNPFTFLQLIRQPDLAQLTMDVQFKGTLRSGLGKHFEYTDIPLKELMQKK